MHNQMNPRQQLILDHMAVQGEVENCGIERDVRRYRDDPAQRHGEVVLPMRLI